MNRGRKDLEAATLFLKVLGIEAGPVIVTVLLNFGLTQSNLERQSKGAWRKEVEAGHVSAALVKDSVKLNRRGDRGNREDKQMLHERPPGLSGCPSTASKGRQKGKDGPGETLMADEKDTDSANTGEVR